MFKLLVDSGDIEMYYLGSVMIQKESVHACTIFCKQSYPVRILAHNLIIACSLEIQGKELRLSTFWTTIVCTYLTITLIYFSKTAGPTKACLTELISFTNNLTSRSQSTIKIVNHVHRMKYNRLRYKYVKTNCLVKTNS